MKKSFKRSFKLDHSKPLDQMGYQLHSTRGTNIILAHEFYVIIKKKEEY